MKTLDQELLKWAHDRVTAEDIDDKYLTVVRKAPAFIQGCGLAQAVGFWRSKADKANFARLLRDLEQIPTVVNTLPQNVADDRRGGRFESVVYSAPLVEYVRLTRRTQAALVFLKRLAVAYAPEAVRDAGDVEEE